MLKQDKKSAEDNRDTKNELIYDIITGLVVIVVMMASLMLILRKVCSLIFKT